jgi:predicted component of type VI protein secretion system
MAKSEAELQQAAAGDHRAQPARPDRRAGPLRNRAGARERGKNLIKSFVSEVLQGAITIAPDTEAMLNARIAQIDHLVSIQLNEILHHPDFQKLEAPGAGSSTCSTRARRATS